MDDLELYLTVDEFNVINAILKTLIIDSSNLSNKLNRENELDENDGGILTLRKKIDF